MKITKKDKLFIIQKYADKYLLKNNHLIDDLLEIESLLLKFEINYGITFKIDIETYKENKGRNLGVVDKLYDLQRLVN